MAFVERGLGVVKSIGRLAVEEKAGRRLLPAFVAGGREGQERALEVVTHSHPIANIDARKAAVPDSRLREWNCVVCAQGFWWN